MNRILKRKKRGKSKIGSIIANHIINNKKNYLISTLLFLVGLIIGIMFINNINDFQYKEISEYKQK